MAFAFFTDSDTSDPVTLQLEGAWLHDPTDPEGTVRQYRFGKDSKSTTIDIGGTSQVFAGRRFPVVDYGEHQADQYKIGVQVPHGETYRADLEAIQEFAQTKRTLVYRDNRGRQMYGTLSGYSDTDQGWGSDIDITMTRVDVEQVTA